MHDLKAHQDQHFVLSKEIWLPVACLRSQKRSTVFHKKTAFRECLRTHFKSHSCERPGCDYNKPFGNRRDLDRHMQCKNLHTRSFYLQLPLNSSTVFVSLDAPNTFS